MLGQIPLLTIFILLKTKYATAFPAQLIEKCFKSNSALTIKESKHLANEVLIAEHSSIFSHDLLAEYEYEISYKGSPMLINNKTRSCLCQEAQCILFCSTYIQELYADMLEQNRSSSDMDLFHILVTLNNGTMVRKHILKDFQPVIYHNFCPNSYSLSPEEDPKHGWALFENGTFFRHHDFTYLTGKEFCFEIGDYSDIINPLNCAIPNNLTVLEMTYNASMVLSVPFFIITILGYSIIPELRNINGKCFLSYLISLTLSYCLITFMNLSKIQFEIVPCIVLGFLNHYMQLTHYTWLAIISYDILQSMNNLAYQPSYMRYARVGWTCPLVWTFLTLWAQITDIPEYLKPGITAQHCGLNVNKWSATIYQYGPCLMVLIFCLFAFINTSRIIKMNEEASHKYRCGLDCPKIRYLLYMRLFLVMGLSWSLDVLSYIFTMFEMTTTSCIVDFVNAVQGLYIFISFIGRQSVRSIIIRRWFSRREHETVISYEC